MDLSRRYVCFFVFLGVSLLEKVLLCDLSSGIRTKCGDNVSFKEDCPKTCCFDTSTTPNCYFQEKDYGPIQHSNGLCINMKDGSDTLIWSADCTSRNAFFLVSYHYPPFHVATGKCVLPSTYVGNPGNADLVLKTGKECKTNFGTYRPTANGNLKYFYGTSEYFVCIGSKSAIITEPHENENVSIQASVCAKDNSCKLSYVYERKIYETRRANFQCESCSTNTIEIIWANYGVEVRDQYPFAISTSWIDCVTTEATSVMQEKCSGKTSCSFIVKEGDFLPSNCRRTTILLVRYTCSNKIPAAPNILYIKVRSQNELLVVWSNDNKNGNVTKFQICWKKAGGTDEKCRDDDVVYSEPRKNRRIYGLEPATKYIVTVARYNSDGNPLGRKRQEVAITRSAPRQASGIKSTSFQIVLGALQSDDKYIQIVVSELRSNATPTDHPENDLQPYDVNTVNNQPYIAAQLDGTNINQNSVFTVGDGKRHDGSNTKKRKFKNVQLEPETYYSVFQRTFQSAEFYYDSDWMDVIKTDKLPPTTTFSTPKQSGGGGASTGAEDGSEKYLAGIIVLIILVIILLVILAYFIYQIRRLKSSKANPENKSKDRNNSEEIDENPDNDDANYEQVENEESTYTALKRPGPGEEENDGHLYAHLNEVHTDYVNQKETGF